MEDRIAFARAARDMLGCPFRLRGRDPQRGIDCVGLVVLALERCGRTIRVPLDYTLANLTVEQWLPFAEDGGLDPIADGPLLSGDILLARPGPARFHLLVAVGEDGFVHADAALRKVALLPHPLRWQIYRRWRLQTR